MNTNICTGIMFVIWLFSSSPSFAGINYGPIVFLATLFKRNYQIRKLLIWAVKKVSRMRQKHNCRFICEGVRMIQMCILCSVCKITGINIVTPIINTNEEHHMVMCSL